MTGPIALQLYTVRNLLTNHYENTIRRVADMGYLGLEAYGSPQGMTAAQARRLFDDLGLQVCAVHLPLPLGDQQQAVIDTMGEYGSNRLACSAFPQSDYQSIDTIRRLCDRVNEAAAVAAQHGFTIGVHNHWFEFQQVEGVWPHHLWLEHLDPAVFLEFDCYWAKVGGADPLAVLSEISHRVTLLHVKDGPADNRESDMTAVGQGTLDYEALIPAAPQAEWLIVELDRCAADMMTAVQDSYTYLTDKGLAHGRH